MNKNKTLVAFAALALLCGAVMADTAQVSITTTNGQPITYSDQIPASGYLDRIEIIQSGGTAATSTVTIATYTGTTAVDTVLTLSSLAGNKVVRPRIIGTTTAGVNLAAAATGTNDYTAGTVLAAPFERPLIGGNLKMAVTEAGGAAANTVTAILYYLPTPR
jgi:phospholipase/lecithinase/hemolysin